MNIPVRLDKSQAKPAVEVLARAFQDDPLFVYLFPDASQRIMKSSHFFRRMVRYGLLYGEVYATSPEMEGVIILLPSENAEMSPWRMLRAGMLLMMSKLSLSEMRRFMRFAEYAMAMNRRLAPFRHQHLAFMGVEPELQGRGYASTLLKTILARINEERLPCYMETHNQKNMPLYEHYGFEVVEEGTIPGTVTGHWAMLRQPLVT